MNSTCFWELSFKVTGSLNVYKWKSENDFSENVGGAEAAAKATFYLLTDGRGRGASLTVLTSPAISLSLAFSYFLPLQLSIVTHPPTSAVFYNWSTTRE